MHGQGQKSEHKDTTKNFVGCHNQIAHDYTTCARVKNKSFGPNNEFMISTKFDIFCMILTSFVKFGHQSFCLHKLESVIVELYLAQ